jgi:hypothetical protein
MRQATAATAPVRSERNNEYTDENVMMKQQTKTKTVNETPLLHCVKGIALAAVSANKAAVSALVLLLLTAEASASSFFFSTGVPDGKIATLSRPAGPGKLQSETADDFVLTEAVVINQATFVGLLPLGSPLGNIGNVEIEIYHVFPADSDVNRIPAVPSRANSPGDVEIESATRNGLEGSLSFAANVLASSFTAANSVVNGINSAPAEFTSGEGSATGEEVQITVSFNPPIALPAGHYFFRPDVLFNGGDFLWLSAPRPIVSPGTPIAIDLQSWIRNDALSPDWLRIGTDITHQGPFNAAFSLSGETDLDGDGVADSLDLCPGTGAGAIVDGNGCSLDQLAPCDGPASGGAWKNHGQYVSAVARAADAFLAQDLITPDEADEIVAQAAQSACGSSGK